MILADTNVWLALCLSGHEHYECVNTWFQKQDDGEVLFCRSTQQSLLRLLTTASLMRLYGNPPLTNAEAWELYCGLVAHKRIGFVQEPPGLEGIWQALAAHKTASPKIWMDSYLAAFAVAGRYRLVTLDLAFQQFSDLKVLLLRP